MPSLPGGEMSRPILCLYFDGVSCLNPLQDIAPSSAFLCSTANDLPSIIGEPLGYSVPLHFERFRYLRKRSEAIKRFNQNLFRDIFAPSPVVFFAVLFAFRPFPYEIMPLCMLMKGQQFKIFYTIVPLVSVLVMNCFVRLQGALQMECHNEAMLQAGYEGISLSGAAISHHRFQYFQGIGFHTCSIWNGSFKSKEEPI